MKTASGLTLLAIGAVLAFAVHGHPWFLNLQVCGWIIMVIGAVGLAIPRRGYGWLRRQVVTRREPDGRTRVGIRQRRYPPYIMINPAAVAEETGNPEQNLPGMPASAGTPATTPTRPLRPADPAAPEEETVEEYFQE